jgi:hypothetical protein
MAIKVPHLISAAFQTFNVQGFSNCINCILSVARHCFADEIVFSGALTK